MFLEGHTHPNHPASSRHLKYRGLIKTRLSQNQSQSKQN